MSGVEQTTRRRVALELGRRPVEAGTLNPAGRRTVWSHSSTSEGGGIMNILVTNDDGISRPG